MTNKQLLTLLESKNACMDAREWVNGQSAKAAWEKCERPDWLFWICGQLGVEQKQIVLAACKCARLALKFVRAGEDRPRLCIETTERWVDGKATIEEVRNARQAASAAYAAASAAASAAYAAASAAASAADAAYASDAYASAAYAAASAADAAYASDAYASDACAADARNKMRKQCCNEIRKVIGFEELLKLAKCL